jgi:prepilin-type processing-associated H-X9-DG protein
MTLIEVMACVTIVVVLALILLDVLATTKKKSSRIGCRQFLQEDALGIKIWEGDNGDHFPQELSITNGGARELLASGNVAAYFQIMSNELSTVAILTCPVDEKRIRAKSWGDLSNTNINYFVNLSASNSAPQTVLFGDDNLSIDGVPVKSGVQNLWTNQSLSWTTKRHHFAGNVAFADGSVSQLSNLGLTSALAASGVATNVVVIP